MELEDKDLSFNYRTHCDPRLNYEQSLGELKQDMADWKMSLSSSPTTSRRSGGASCLATFCCRDCAGGARRSDSGPMDNIDIITDASYSPLLLELLQNQLGTLDDDLVLDSVDPVLQIFQRFPRHDLQLSNNQRLPPVDLPDHPVHHDTGVLYLALLVRLERATDGVFPVESARKSGMKVDDRDRELLVQR
jgi:hypothetical protein